MGKDRKTQRLCISQWAPEDRPREKALDRGIQALTKAELLAILIGSGSPEESAVALMQRLLADCHGRLRELGRMSLQDLCAYHGIGPAKAITLQAACRIGVLTELEPEAERPVMNTSSRIAAYMRPRLENLPHEECHVLCLDNSLHLLASRCVARGGLTSTAVDVRCVLREALLVRATAIVLCHNHPSGQSRPSQADDRLTEHLGRAAAQVDVRLLDHVILCGTRHYSYADEGRL